MEESKLYEGLIRDDTDSIKTFYQKEYKKSIQFLLKRGIEEEDAKDIFQDSLITLLQNIKSGKFKYKLNLSTYFYAILKFRSIVFHRKKKKLSESDINSDNLIFEETADFEEESDIQELLNIGLKALSEDCRRIIADFYFHRMSLKEIAEKNGYTSDFIRVKKVRCLQKFKETIQNSKGYEEILNREV